MTDKMIADMPQRFQTEIIQKGQFMIKKKVLPKNNVQLTKVAGST